MGHIQDRWFTTKFNTQTGKGERVKTAQHGTGKRYKVRYLDPAGRERSKCFPDKCKALAEDFLTSVEADQRAGTYVDPDAGNMLLRDYAENWIKGQASSPSSRYTIRSKMDSRILAYLGDKPLRAVAKPAVIREWLEWLRNAGLSENYCEALYRMLSGMLASAVEDNLIRANPCRSQGIARPRNVHVPAVAWEPERVERIRAAMSERDSIAVVIGVSLGLRIGEILGLSPADIDTAAGVVHIRRQVKKVQGALVFAPPKRGKLRDVPLAPDVAARLRQHLTAYPAAEVTLPWNKPGGATTTVALIVHRNTGDEAQAWGSTAWNHHVWNPAFRAACITKRPKVDGAHALRHTYASLLLADGVSIRELAAYLGHSNPGFTLRVYTHMTTTSHDRAQHAVTAYLRSHLRTDFSSHGLQAA
ncbi:site-specific integrase [Saccharopolyspora sp. 6T]|uniref:tyrosine-type recombinase/integrase n=1 Tax=Saccharopolyspora sp. 6T TaxID=2877238 RepID=UPI001CD2953A|nr:tyrosine-type recombinase/integrase [Saccharopolyspora sp. 6T]MCA1188564.1 site-specific integrase [Saccharopolyspora sp. 6T]